MRWPLCVLLLFMLVGASLWCEEYLKLTFSDGKVLVGYFDERKGTITLDDGATRAVKVDDIIRREPVARDQPKLDIPPPVKPPAEEVPQTKTSTLPTQTATDSLPLAEALHQARRRWIAVLRETKKIPDELPDELAQRLASARADLDAATTALQHVNASSHADLTPSR